MHLKAQLPAAIAAALFAAGPILAGQVQPEPVAVPGSTTAQSSDEMSGNDFDKQLILSSAAAKVNGTLEMTGYNVLLRSGAELPLLEANGGIHATAKLKFGAIYDLRDHPVMDGATARISNDNDFNSLIQGPDDRLYLISHFESRPGAIYQTLLNQGSDGTLSPQATRYVDFKGYQGGWVHCAGSVSPWGTHLGSEEYEPDARMWSGQTGGTDACANADPAKQRPSNYESAMVQYLVDGSDAQYAPSCVNARDHMNPYRYGWPLEVAVGTDGLASVAKHFAMGRMASELSYAMPDAKTVYITDDGTNTMLLMFIADTAGDLDAGTLYAAKWTHLSGNEAKGGRGAISWVNLGHATSADVQAAIAGQTFDNLYEVGALNSPDDGTCGAGFTSINAGHGAANHECLKAKGNVTDTVLSRLETRRYAAMHGAATEFRKVEGFTFNPEQRIAYMAISELNKGMENNTGSDVGGPNQIRLARNDCGAVYQLPMAGRVKDTAGNPIDSAYVVVQMSGLLAGAPVVGSLDQDTDKKTTNTCSLNGLANPDNLTYLPRYNTLIIGEDTGSGHQNDAIWSYDLRAGKLTRVLTTPYGSETTSPYWYPDLKGHAYLMGVVQHPYGESDTGAPGANEDAKHGYVGYFKFPTLK